MNPSQNDKIKIVTIIPFRLKSSRFENKALARCFNIPLIENALKIASRMKYDDIVVTAPQEDYERVTQEIDLKNYTYRFIPSQDSCRCGTDRVLEIYPSLDADLFVSIPVDEAALKSSELERCLDDITELSFDAMTLYCDFYCIEDAQSPLSAKIVVSDNSEILYMSRSLIPSSKSNATDITKLKKNVGVFFFTRKFLDNLSAIQSEDTSLDTYEGLEQLRWLELGFTIQAKKIIHDGFGIDVPEQLSQLEERIKSLQE